MESSNSRTADDDRIGPRGPCHENASPLPPSPLTLIHHVRRKMMRHRCTMKRLMTIATILLTIQLLLFGYRASDDHDDATAYAQLERRLQGDTPWIPDQEGLRCRNDLKKEPWNPTHLTIESCCARHFNWDEPTCNKNSFEWFAESVNPFKPTQPKQLYYPDTAAGICKLDSPDKPEWVTILVSSYSECCMKHISWGVEKCMQSEPVITPASASGPKPTESPTKNPYTGFYADTGLRKCLPNSADKPEWNKDVAPTQLECCKNYLDWAFADCVMDIPPTLKPAPNPYTTNAPVVTYDGFYADTGLRKCLPNSADKPDWNKDVAPTQLECCTKYLDWAFADCAKDIPPTLKPVMDPTATKAPVVTYDGFYADTGTRKCLPVTIDKPAWNNDVAPTQLECCTKYLDWAFADCAKDIPPTLKPVMDPTATNPPVVTYESYYADTGTRKCLPVTIDKPAWNNDVAPTQLECCTKYLDWAFAECAKDIPPTLKPVMDPTATNPPVVTYESYYADEAARKCLPVTIDKPAWNDLVAPTQLECCTQYLDWAFAECARDIPLTLRPTPIPTLKPTPEPTKAPVVTPPPSPQPTKAPVPTNPPSLSPTTLYRPTLHPTTEPPTNKPTTEPPTNKPTTSRPTSKPTSLAPTWSPSAILYYPDSTLSYCLEDSVDRPQWNQDLVPDYAECCEKFLPWVYSTCMKNKPVDPSVTTTSSTTLVPITRYYADTTLSKCVEDSESRPTWIEESALEPDYTKCCEIHLSWVYDECMKHAPNAPLAPSEEVAQSPTSSPTTSKYYADTTLSKCVRDSASRPLWIQDSALVSDYAECCKTHLSWVYDECMKHAPPEEQKEEELVAMDASVPDMADCPSLGRRKCKQNNHCWWRRAPLRRCEYKDDSVVASATTTTVATTAPSLYKYYVDNTNGKCLIHTADTPGWVAIHKTFQDCCEASWLATCEEYIPLVPMNGDGSSNEDDHILIEVVARGSLNLFFLTSPPSPTTVRWYNLVKALRNTFMEIFEKSEHFHPDMELRLVSLGYTSLLQRLLSSVQELDDNSGQHRELEKLTKLEFEVTLPLLCDAKCQLNSWNLGVESFAEVEQNFVDAVNSGVFASLVFENGYELGIFSVKTDSPVAGDAKLTYQYSFTSEKTLKPSPEPTSVIVNEEGFVLEFYPDYVNNVCKSDGNPPDYEDNFFDTLEDCCSFAWIKYDVCKKNSVIATRPPTPNPTRNPTRKPTPKPSRDDLVQNSGVACSSIGRRRKCIIASECKWRRTASGNYCVSRSATNQPTKPPTPSPTQKPTPEPTPKPQTSKPTGTVYYPDLEEGICKYDGKHGATPYQFATAQQCCNNALFDYLSCMKKTNPYAIIETNAPSPKPTPRPTPEPTPMPAAPSPSGSSTQTHCMWHPNPRAYGTCTFSNDYPSSWESDSMKPHYLHYSYEACCDIVFKNAGCEKEVACDIDSGETEPLNPTTVPSIMPTKKPTKTPTTKPTPRPTEAIAETFQLTAAVFDGFEDGLTAVLPWTTTPNLPWSTDDSDKHEGSFSARSHPVKPGEESNLEIAITSIHGGTIDFWIQSDVQMPFSGALINLDGETKIGLTYPSSQWKAVTIPIPPGEHVLVIRGWSPTFSLPSGGNHVSHTVRVDSLSFNPTIIEGFEGGKLQFDSEMTFVGEGEWGFDSTSAQNGITSLRSPIIGAGQSSTVKLETSVPTGGSIISFWWRASVWMPVDSFAFKIDGQIKVQSVTPNDEWKLFTTAIAAGARTMEWIYERGPNDAALSQHPGEGRVWIDELKVVPKS